MVPGFGLAWRRRHAALLAGALVLTTLYTLHYLGHTARPGGNPTYPAGWWGWWDQSNYLKSALALGRLDFDPGQHLYPLGYSLLGAGFVALLPQHPFFLVNLAALLTTLVAFTALARRCGVGAFCAVPTFVLATAADPVLLQQWAIPWSTTPLAALIWTLLAVAAAHLDGRRRPGWLGFLAVCIPILRPVDLLLALPPLAVCLLADLRHQRLSRRDLAVFAASGLFPSALYLSLHMAIYGLQPSAYLRGSSAIGFSLHELGWKAFLILLDPQPWIGGGEGLLRRAPWLLLGLAGLLPALLRPQTAVLAAVLVLHGVLYLSYVDLLATGFWRYFNVHYWTWALPGFALLGLLLLRDLTPSRFQPRVPVLMRHRLAGFAGLVMAASTMSLRYDPVPAQPGQSIDAADFAAEPPGFDPVYFAAFTIEDAAGSLANITHVRAIPFGHSIRVLALTRALQPPIRVESTGARALGLEGVALVLLHAQPRLGNPFQAWKPPGKFFGPR